ncbi:DNA mismatch repair protein MutT [Azonexus hydrophilus]|uniref:8-oxo-dGTP diphosphatase n=1 Tax=Azonexus hydrophilus TaxID=418702 RepID=A0A1R1I2G7_9RHOO|nr:Nudix family hydrolase [Azonexus hydrophilus]OMG52956.1 DNA mismatch repair protein MutT [Azonexus hydrophilus]
MSAVVRVAAAVMLRSDGREFLLAQRPEGKVYAGYWEFPGGKVEAGESMRDALVRELHEEMGITVTACTPWLTRRFTYPHATVHLEFWRVTAWTGEIGITGPLEHAAVDWQEKAKSPTVEPILPANGPILKALSLPETMLITHAEGDGTQAQLARLAARLKQHEGSLPPLIQLRDKQLPANERQAFAAAVVDLAHAHGALVVINDDAALARDCGADGLHLSAGALAATQQRPDFAWVGASCHTAGEVARAGELELDYALLGPVLPTPTHPEHPGIGWDEFAARRADNGIPVLALGGMQESLRATAMAHGAHGIALMRGW